jgi:hypothetical protein
MGWVGRVALVLGPYSVGGLAYEHFVELGWGPSAALVTAVMIAVGLGVLVWAMVTVRFGRLI